MSMNQNHPIQYLVSEDYAKSQQWLQIVIADTLYITAGLFFAVYYCTGFSPFTLFINDHAFFGILIILVPALAVFLFRYNLHERLPLWLRLTIKIACAVLCSIGIIHLCLTLTA